MPEYVSPRDNSESNVLQTLLYSLVKAHALVSKPMHQETPLFFHPPEFSKSAKTNLALLRGER